MRILLPTRFLLPLAFALVGLGNAHADGIPNQGTWETTLLGRDINLNPVAATDASAVYLYDKTLDITWLRDANANVTGKVTADANASVNGAMNWNTAMSWATNLVTGSGATAISDWRLPTMTDPAADENCSSGCINSGYTPATSSSEMASLFFGTLGNKYYYDANGNAQLGYGLINAGSFQNMQTSVYWLGTEYASRTTNTWQFNTGMGWQYSFSKEQSLFATAVRPGDVLAPVPEPEAYAMLLAGLGVIGAVARRRQAGKPLATRS